MGLLSTVRELNRQRAARDDKFFRNFLYYFELIVGSAAEVGPAQPYLYPLVLAPEALSMSEPFAVDRAHTAGGGLFVEEQGIVAREISISGTTGWAPRRLPRGTSGAKNVRFPAHPSFTRATTKGSDPFQVLSGQRHFQFLQDTVFRTYADLKQDPSTAEGTELYFHNVKDDEHWRVIPLSFRTNRSTGRNLEYQYDIQLLAVAGTPVVEARFSEDRPVLSKLRDTFACLKTGLAMCRAALQDLGNVQGELRALNSEFSSLFDGSIQLVDATADLLDGSAQLISLPYRTASNTIASGFSALNAVNEGVLANVDEFLAVPDNAINIIRQLMDGVMLLGSFPEKYRNTIQAAVDKFQRQQSFLTSRKTSTLQLAAASQSPSSLSGFSGQGSSSRPGDFARANDDLGLGKFVPRFTSAVERIIEQGDTLASLAAKYLGDARLWKYVAIFNDLRPPFISNDGFPGTLGIGDSILIPTFSTPAVVRSSPATFGVRADERPEVHALGRDLEMRSVGRNLYDLVVDEDGGSTDFEVVEGIPNLKQAIRSRIITERGTDLLYKTLGTSRIVGLGLTEVDYEIAQFRLTESILSDPRIAGIRSVTFDTDQPDAVVASVQAEVRGFTRPELIAVASAE